MHNGIKYAFPQYACNCTAVLVELKYTLSIPSPCVGKNTVTLRHMHFTTMPADVTLKFTHPETKIHTPATKIT
jgi:hypothetical protein